MVNDSPLQKNEGLILRPGDSIYLASNETRPNNKLWWVYESVPDHLQGRIAPFTSSPPDPPASAPPDVTAKLNACLHESNDELRAEVQALTEQLGGAKAAQSAAEAAKNQLEQQNEELQKALSECKAQLQERTSNQQDASRLKKQVAELSTRSTQLAADVAERDTRIAELQSELELQTKQLADERVNAEKQAALLKEQIGELESKSSSSDQQIQELKTSLEAAGEIRRCALERERELLQARYNEQIQRVRQEMSEQAQDAAGAQAQQLKGCEKALAAEKRRAEQLKADVARRDDEIKALNEDLHLKDKRLATKESEMEVLLLQRDELCRAHDFVLEGFNEGIKKAKANLRAIMANSSGAASSDAPTAAQAATTLLPTSPGPTLPTHSDPAAPRSWIDGPPPSRVPLSTLPSRSITHSAGAPSPERAAAAPGGAQQAGLAPADDHDALLAASQTPGRSLAVCGTASASGLLAFAQDAQDVDDHALAELAGVCAPSSQAAAAGVAQTPDRAAQHVGQDAQQAAVLPCESLQREDSAAVHAAGSHGLNINNDLGAGSAMAPQASEAPLEAAPAVSSDAAEHAATRSMGDAGTRKRARVDEVDVEADRQHRPAVVPSPQASDAQGRDNGATVSDGSGFERSDSGKALSNDDVSACGTGGRKKRRGCPQPRKVPLGGRCGDVPAASDACAPSISAVPPRDVEADQAGTHVAPVAVDDPSLPLGDDAAQSGTKALGVKRLFEVPGPGDERPPFAPTPSEPPRAPNCAPTRSADATAAHLESQGTRCDLGVHT